MQRLDLRTLQNLTLRAAMYAREERDVEHHRVTEPNRNPMSPSNDDQPGDAPTPSEGRKLRRTFELADDTPTAFDRPTASLIPNMPGEETAATPEDEIRDSGACPRHNFPWLQTSREMLRNPETEV